MNVKTFFENSQSNNMVIMELISISAARSGINNYKYAKSENNGYIYPGKPTCDSLNSDKKRKEAKG